MPTHLRSLATSALHISTKPTMYKSIKAKCNCKKNLLTTHVQQKEKRSTHVMLLLQQSTTHQHRTYVVQNNNSKSKCKDKQKQMFCPCSLLNGFSFFSVLSPMPGF
jgi:hypothetical protein